MKTEPYRQAPPRRHVTCAPACPPDVVCLSHLRYDFVFQRPHHLLTRCAKRRRVFFIEEPVSGADLPRIDVRQVEPGFFVAVPQLPPALDEAQSEAVQRRLLSELLRRHAISDYLLWYYTPMALPITEHLSPRAVVYDCMDELSAFAGAPASLREREAALLRRADLVLTGGYSLYDAKRTLHHNVHPLPSSVDAAHFACARQELPEPADQAGVPRPRLGFFGVIDERMDLDLVAGVAASRPDLQLMMIGPVVKIDPRSLPALSNIHWVGRKSYAELPAYLSGWDVAILPFARNEATRFISPTKTPEYLAAGKQVVSTSIRDVVRPYGELGLVHIADRPGDFIAAVDACLAEERGPGADLRRASRRARIDDYLARMSWDFTWARVEALLAATVPPAIHA